MSQNDFQQYGFEHYDRVPLNQRRGIGGALAGFVTAAVRNPLIATVLLLVVGVGIAGAVISGLSGGADDTEVPVVKAESLAFKERPAERGGMEVDNQDSTIYMSIMDEVAQESAPIENLLEDDAGRSLEDELQAMADDEGVEQADAVNERSAEEVAEMTAKNMAALAELKRKAGEVEAVQAEVKAVEETVEEKAVDKVVESRVEPPQIPSSHSAGSNPETLEFVRNVLDKKDANVALNAPATRDHIANDVATRMAKTEPAVGSQAAVAIKPGDYFVQLASVTNAAGAEGEWGKLQKAYPSLLTNVDHRVTSADLGERGIYYRIQAGPMSQDSANALCDKIKAQKPGGCLVTK